MVGLETKAAINDRRYGVLYANKLEYEWSHTWGDCCRAKPCRYIDKFKALNYIGRQGIDQWF